MEKMESGLAELIGMLERESAADIFVEQRSPILQTPPSRAVALASESQSP
jgi:hypothetical protein